MSVCFLRKRQRAWHATIKSSTCGEGFDLNDLTLTGAQPALIKAVQATGKPVILVLVTGKPFCHSLGKEKYTGYPGTMVCRGTERELHSGHPVRKGISLRSADILFSRKYRTSPSLL